MIRETIRSEIKTRERNGRELKKAKVRKEEEKKKKIRVRETEERKTLTNNTDMNYIHKQPPPPYIIEIYCISLPLTPLFWSV